MPERASPPSRGYLRALPTGVRTVVRERRRRLLSQATGRVLDLGGSEAHRRLYRHADEVFVLGAHDRPGSVPGRFDTIVSIMRLAAVDDPALLLDRLHDRLAPGGRFVFLEPSRDVGRGARIQTLVAPAARIAAGWRPDRDPVALIRDHGWVIDDLERIPMPRYAWPLTALAEGAAVLVADRGER